MKKLIAGVLVLTILGSCGNKKTNIDPFASITQEVDSIRHKADSIHQEELPEEPKPTEADHSPLPQLLLPVQHHHPEILHHFQIREMRKPISKNATGSMMTYLPNSIIIRSCLIKKKTWIWWGTPH